MRTKNYLKLFLAGCILCCLFGACEKKEQREPSMLEITEPESFQLVLKEATPTSVKVEVENFAEEDLHWGSWTLEEKVDGIWYNIEFVPPEGVVLVDTLILPCLAQGETHEIFWSWEKSVEPLKPGQYRVIKDFFYEEKEQKDKIHVACEFEIE